VEAEFQQLQRDRAQAQEERKDLTSGDEFLPHGVDEAAMERLRGQLDRIGGVGRAWLVRKRLSQAHAAPPHFVMLVKWRGMILSQESRLQQILDAADLPGSVMAFVATNRRRIAGRVRKAAGEPLYRKGWW
jgi:hypothetical protein